MKRFFIAVHLLVFTAVWSQENETPKKEKEIDGVTITKKKKAVEQKADRTVFDFSEQQHLNSGSTLDGMKKLPGLIVSDLAGMVYQGKPLEVYMDGRPLNISSNELTSFLEGMPANSIDRIEVITQPGAEFPATSGGAILNIITSKSAKNYLTANYSGGYSFSDYDKYRNIFNNSILLNAKNKLFGWQLNVGQTYRENPQGSKIDELSDNFSDRRNRGYFVKAATTFDLGNDRLILNYNANIYNNDNNIHSLGKFENLGVIYDTENKDFSDTETLRQEFAATFQKRMDDKKLDFKFTYSNYDSDYRLFTNVIKPNQQSFLNQDNNSLQNVYNFKVDYSQPLKVLDGGKISFGGLYEKYFFDTRSKGVKNLDYERQTASTYFEAQVKFKKMDFIAGIRAEDYDMGGKTDTVDLTPYSEFKWFPNASFQYNFVKSVYFNFNYNKKITLPGIWALNPNNNQYQNGNIVGGGNPNLRPTIYDNFEAKFSAFDYIFIGYNYGLAKNQVVERISRSGYVIKKEILNISELKIHNFNLGVPIPFAIFSKSIKEIMSSPVNPDQHSFLYVYVGYQKHEDIPNIDTKGFWIYNLSSQIILPQKLKLMATYNYITRGGNYYYYEIDKPLNHSFDLTLSRKFLKDNLNVSLYANDIFKTGNNAFKTANTPYVYISDEKDSQKFGITVNYKIPTKNKLAKEDPNLIKEGKRDDEGGMLNQ